MRAEAEQKRAQRSAVSNEGQRAKGQEEEEEAMEGQPAKSQEADQEQQEAMMEKVLYNVMLMCC
jgi:hypothetical protein